MPKKKINKRKDYDLEARDMTVYDRSRIQRKMAVMILRGPGLKQQDVVIENPKLNHFAKLKHFKIKLVQAKSEEDVILFLRDGNTWAGGIIFNPGSLDVKTETLKKVLKKLLIPVTFISGEDVTVDSYFTALTALIDSQPEK